MRKEIKVSAFRRKNQGASSSPITTRHMARRSGVLAVMCALAVGLAGCTAGSSPETTEQVNGIAPLAPQSGQPHTTSTPAPRPNDESQNPKTSEQSGTPSAKTKSTVTTKPGNKPAEPEKTDNKQKQQAASPKVAADAKQAEVAQAVAKPIPVEKAASTETFDVSVAKVEGIHGDAEGIGEIAGPAIRFEMTVRNTSDKTISLENAVVLVDYGKEDTPAIQLSESGATDFPAQVEAGKDASGTFVFQIPAAERASFRILFNYSANERIVAFKGTLPHAKG